MTGRFAMLSFALGGWLALGGWGPTGGALLAADEPSVAELIEALKSSDKGAQVKAIDQLGALHEAAADAVKPLTELLQNVSEKVRLHAAHALGQIGKPAVPAVPALTELLKDPNAATRREAIKAVMTIRPGPEVTVPLCVKLLEDSDPGIRVRILNAIAEAGSPAVPGLIAALKNEKSAYWACLVLREMGPEAKEAIPALIEALKSKRPEIRREAALTLGGMEGAAATATNQLAALLKDPDVATAATYALGRIGRVPPAVETTIRSNVKSNDHLLGTTSLWVMASLHPQDKALRAGATEQLIARLSDPDPYDKAAAARALAALPPAPEITLPIWQKALKNADEATVSHAMDALARLGAPAVPMLIDALKHEKLRPQIAEVLRHIGPPAAGATDALAKLLDDPNEEVAHEAVLALGGIGPSAKSAVPALVKALQTEDGPHAHVTIYTLGRIGPGAMAAQPVLIGLLKSTDQDLALISAWAITRIQPGSKDILAKAVPVLIAGLDAPNAVSRRGAAESLGSLGPQAKSAVAALEKAAKDHDKSVRDAATQALTAIRG